MIPVPHNPMAGLFPIVFVTILFLPNKTARQTAPGTPGIPQDMFPPSNAGPAATDETRK